MDQFTIRPLGSVSATRKGSKYATIAGKHLQAIRQVAAVPEHAIEITSDPPRSEYKLWKIFAGVVWMGY